MARSLAALLALTLLLTACGGDDPPADTATTGTGTGITEETEAPDAQATLMAGTTGLGDTLLDGSGRAVYLFDNDADGASTCTDQCATAWPPLVIEGPPVAGDGVDASLLATITRADGATQVTYAGRPLYHFAGDENPGDIKGHGVNEVWWLLRPDGSAMPASAVGMGY